MSYYSVMIAGRSRKTRFKGSRHKVYSKLHKLGYSYNKKLRFWHMPANVKARYAPVKNVEVIMTIYIFETKDNSGRTLELDVVAKMVISLERYKRISSVPEYFKAIVKNQFENKHYGGLAAAIEYVDNNTFKSGLQITYTNAAEMPFEFVRVRINGIDYLKKIKEGVSNVKSTQRKLEPDKE